MSSSRSGGGILLPVKELNGKPPHQERLRRWSLRKAEVVVAPMNAGRTSDAADQVLPLFNFDTYDEPNCRGEMLYCRRIRTADHCIKLLNPKGPLALSIQWTHTIVKGQHSNSAAMVQLADRDLVVLIHLSELHDTIPPGLLRLLADPARVKVGFGIREVGEKLFRDLKIEVSGSVDLNDLVTPRKTAPKLVGAAAILSKWDLPGLTAEILGRRIDEMEAATLEQSDWSQGGPLSDAQLRYAANKVSSAAMILEHLRSRALKDQIVARRLPYGRYWNWEKQLIDC